MRVLVQWATATVADWVTSAITSLADVRAMPRKPVPSDSPLIDDQPGWAAAVNIQGVVLTGDHVGFSLPGGVLTVGVWNDDPADWPTPWGLLYTFGTIKPDTNLPVPEAFALANPGTCELVGGTWYVRNTDQTCTPYADAAALQALVATDPVEYAWCQRLLDTPTLRPWADWPRFQNNNVVHGVWLNDPLWDSLTAARSARGWEEWRDV